jgi:hypothetical protein
MPEDNPVRLVSRIVRDIKAMEHAYDERKIEQAEATKRRVLESLEELRCLLSR